MSYSRSTLLFFVTLALGAASVIAQDFTEVQITSVKAGDNIYMLQGSGGNIGLFYGDDGLFIIDDQFAPLHQKLITAIKELSGVTSVDLQNAFVLNTHFHPDHTGGNELMGGSGAVIVAHENGRRRLTVEQFVPFFGNRHPALSTDGLPVVTFTRDITFHLNGEEIRVFHTGSAHTDGDAMVHFVNANVIHAGDILFMQTYPFVDLDNGGSIAGVITAVEKLLTLCDDNTKIIPGHGNMTDLAGLKEYHHMLTTTYDRVKKMVAENMTLEQIRQAKPTAEFDATTSGFISADTWVGFLFREMTG